MSLPSTREIGGVILEILSTARDDDQLSQLTVRIVRQKLAAHFDIEEDVLNGEKYKSFIKTTVHATVDGLKNASDEGRKPPRRNAVKKEKAGGAARTGPRKPGAKAQSQEEADAFESEVPPPKKASRSKPSSKPAKSNDTSKKRESETKYKSKAMVESSDEEAAAESGTQKPARSHKERQVSTKSTPLKQKQQRKVNKDDSDVEMNPVKDPGPSSSSKPKHTIESPQTSISKAKKPTGDPMESELSSVIDEPPKKRQKKQERESAKPQKDENTRRGKKEVLSKDEETVNRLKGIVVACGVRKVWKKEFEGLDKPSQQIKRLHSILGDLGMTTRYSLEKAKAIREQRELAQELKDVQEFEKVTKRHGKAPRSSSEEEESADQGGSDMNVPTRKKQNARASIMAFLEDQSEEE